MGAVSVRIKRVWDGGTGGMRGFEGEGKVRGEGFRRVGWGVALLEVGVGYGGKESKLKGENTRLGL